MVIGGLSRRAAVAASESLSLLSFRPSGRATPLPVLGYSWQSQIWGELGPLFELDHHDTGLCACYVLLPTVQTEQTSFLRRIVLQ